MRAIGGPTQGLDFMIVWLVTPAAFEAEDETRAIPWPVSGITQPETV